MIEGLEMFGFPFTTGDDVRSSPAVADLDKDNSLELIFGSHDGSLNILTGFGQQLVNYQINGSINGSPAAVDLDQDGDLEVVFTSYNGSTGDVHAIHHNGSSFYGFPVYLNEKMVGGAAAGEDLECALADAGEQQYWPPLHRRAEPWHPITRRPVRRAAGDGAAVRLPCGDGRSWYAAVLPLLHPLLG